MRNVLCASLSLALVLVGCDKPAQVQLPEKSPGAKLKTFSVKGVVKTVDLGNQVAMIQHEAIPDYMPAMTMPFDVRDTNELTGLQSGDNVSFRLNVTDDDSWIDQVKRLSTATNAAAFTPPVRLVRDVEPLDVGDQMPDYTLTNELGEAVRFSDFKGKALAFTFIFTRCPMPEFCPLMTRNFSETYEALVKNKGAPTNWHLMSISFDPVYDTPAVLKTYARRQDANPKRWSFATGALIDIDAITEQFYLSVSREKPDALPVHTLRTVVLDTTGKIQKIFIGNRWKSDELAEELIKAAQIKRE